MTVAQAAPAVQAGLVPPVADHFQIVACFDAERQCTAIHFDEFSCGRDHHTDRRCRKMAHIEMNAEALVARWQVVFDRFEGGCLE